MSHRLDRVNPVLNYKTNNENLFVFLTSANEVVLLLGWSVYLFVCQQVEGKGTGLICMKLSRRVNYENAFNSGVDTNQGADTTNTFHLLQL